MRLLMFVSALGILVSIAILIMVLIKAKRDKEREETPPTKARATRLAQIYSILNKNGVDVS
jgi:hypothetical protein